MTVVALFTPPQQRMNEAWARFRDKRDEACNGEALNLVTRTDALISALAELNRAIAEARASGFHPDIQIAEEPRR